MDIIKENYKTALYSDPCEDNFFSRSHTALSELKTLDKNNLNEFLRTVIRQAAHTLDSERVSIWFYTEDRQYVYCDYSYIKKLDEYTSEITISVKDYPNYFKSIENQLCIAADDAQNDPQTAEFAKNYLLPRGIYSMMDVPIHYRGKTIGIICHETSPRKWRREEIDFATTVSALVSSAVETDIRKKQERDFTESQRFLSTLISNLPGYVYRVIKKSDSWSIQYISEGVFDLTGYSTKELLQNGRLYYGLIVYEEDKESARKTVTESLKEKKPYQITYRIKCADGDIKWVWEQGRGVYSDDGQLIATEGFVTDITEKKLAEDELIKRNNELSALNRIGQSLSKLAEPNKTINDISDMLGRLFNIDNLYIALYNDEKDYITFPYYSIEGEMENNEGRKFSNGLTEYVINSKRPLLLNSAINEFFESLGIARHNRKAKSILSSPIMTGDKVIGVITLQDYQKENAFTMTQLEILSTVSSQIAIAIENAILYGTITKSLREKDVLLQEVHHRVKNNLQIMSSLVKLQSHYINDPKMLEILKETESRIHSMAIVHSKLHTTKDYEKINFYDYVKNLTDNFWNSYGFRLKNVEIKINISDLSLNIDTAIPCGLIINELVLNSIKYAFPNDRKGVIDISLLNQGNNRFVLRVKDDGIGLPKGINITESDTLGIQLVTLLSKQMNGTVEIKSSPDKGVEFTISFEEAVYKARR
ncbi:MAG: GAF domain-containing protein [Chlorobi bacterium]|nr:GAF domain-containing protein [Chlorobiota bacterium]MCI0717186.1 GAF domain-containing protein [Chlorobiota bacterium]